MKKIMLVLGVLVAATQAYAQFEKGTWYLNTSVTGLNLSHSKYEGTNFGFSTGGGAFIADNLAMLLVFKGNYVEHGMDETSFGAGARYYFSNCGVYGGLGLAYKYSLVDQDYELLILNEPLVTVEYQQDGSSCNMYRQYWNNPKGFAFLRKADMKLALTWKRKFMSCIHYVSSSLRSGNKRFIQESPLPLLTVLAILPGVMLYKYTEYKVKSGQKYNVK